MTSLVPFSPSVPTDAQRAWSLGQYARSLYDAWFDRTNLVERRAVWETMARKKNSTKGRGKAGGGTRTDSYPAIAGHAGIQRSDLALSRRWRNIPQRIPRQISAQIVWDVVRITSNISNSISAIVETNFSFNLSTHPEVSQWSALFDQWCIPQVAVTFTSTEPPGGTGNVPSLLTAVDFDNTTNLGSQTLLLEYENAQSVLLGPGMSHTRACHPCLKLSLASSGSSSGVDKMWCDSGTPGATWFGIRSILGQSGVATVTLNVTQTLWYAFRNGI